MPNPLPMLNLSGSGTQRGVTLALPVDKVRSMLPAGLELGRQDVTPAGTHPVMVFFHDIYRAYLSFPTLVPSLTYREHSVGVPFVHISGAVGGPSSPGPYYYMPTLYLNSILATLGGVAYWGFTKKPAHITRADGEYRVFEPAGGPPITSLTWEPTGEHRPVGDYAHFQPIRQILSQPLISMLPMSLGPFFVLSDFEKGWDVATLRPLQTVTHVHRQYVPGYDVGRYPSTARSPGIDRSVLGSFELWPPLRLTLPYPPLLFDSQVRADFRPAP